MKSTLFFEQAHQALSLLKHSLDSKIDQKRIRALKDQLAQIEESLCGSCWRCKKILDAEHNFCAQCEDERGP